MSRRGVIDLLENRDTRKHPGGIDIVERWWVERQEALARAGYMLRSRYRPTWKPSWVGTNKFYLDFEDGQSVIVSPHTPCHYGA